MATIGKKAPVAAKQSAPTKKPAAKAVPAKAAVPAKKAAPAPVVEEVAEEEELPPVEVGNMVRFIGYDESVPEDDRVLTEGEEYEVVGFSEAEGDDPGGDPIVRFANPAFNPKKKEHPDTNPKESDVVVFSTEYEPVMADEEPVEEPVEEAAPAPAGRKGRKTAAEVEAAAAVAAAAAVEEGEDDEGFPDLENEDEEVLALIASAEGDLISAAQELETQVGQLDFQLGGILYHIRKDKSYLEVEGAEEAGYMANKGFETFIDQYFNCGYRKGMYLIEIYKHFTLAGIPDAAAQVAAMGWTKASKIAKLVSAEGAKPEDLIELANNSTVADLSTAIMEQTRVGGGGEIVPRLTIKFRFIESEAKFMNEVLAQAQEKLGLADIGQAMLQIVTEWAQANGGGSSKATGKQAAPSRKAVAPSKKATAKA